MKNFNIIISVTFLMLLSISCSDDNINKPDVIDCKLQSYTDSTNYYYEVEYKDSQVFSLNYYKFEDNEVKDLIRRIEINRNLFNEIINIVYTNDEGKINFVDSVYRNQNGLPYEIVTFNSLGEYVEKTVRFYNNFNQAIEELQYIYDGTWNKNSKSIYQYDSKGRIVERSFEQFTANGSRKEHSVYEYDEMKNINKLVDIFTLFDTNNFTKVTTTYTSLDGNEIVGTKTYLYEYNDEGYPIIVETTSSSNANVTFRYNTIVCD